MWSPGPKATPVTPRCWRIWYAPTGSTTGRSPGTASWPRRSRCWPVPHQNLIWSRQRQANALRSTLREFYPAALAAFDELAGRDALAVLDLAPTPARGRALSRSKIAAALRRAGRQRNVEARAEQIQTALRIEQLAALPAVEAAFGHTVTALVRVLAELSRQIDTIEGELSAHFDRHPGACRRNCIRVDVHSRHLGRGQLVGGSELSGV